MKEHMRLLYAVYFRVDEVFERARLFQEANLNNTEVYQHPEDKLLPLEWDEFTSGDKKYFTWYACEHTKVYYKESMYWWPIGYNSWMEEKHTDFNCKIMDFISSYIRIQHYIPFQHMEEEVNSYFVNTDPETAAKLLWKIPATFNMTQEELTQIRFRRFNDYRQQVFVDFNLSQLAGLKTFTYAFHSHHTDDHE